MTIDTKSPIPKYHQLRDIILRTIREGGIGVGSLLPSESEMVRRFGVSRNTVRQAIEELAKGGIVVRRRGKGTYCQAPAEVRTRLLGVITPFVSQYIYPEIIHGIEQQAHARGYSMILGNSNCDAEKERELLETMLDKGIEGLLIEPVCSALVRPDTYVHQRLATAPVPVVLMDCEIEGLASSLVTPADCEGGRIATEYLLRQGHRRIAIVHKAETVPGVQRYAGYRSALAAAGIEPPAGCAVAACEGRDHDLAPIRQAVSALLDLGDERPTAIFFYNDEWAMQGMQVVLDRGLHVPRDVSILGFDDTDFCCHARVPITSLTHPKGELGRVAAELLLDEIAGLCRGKKRVSIVPTIVERESVAPPRVR